MNFLKIFGKSTVLLVLCSFQQASSASPSTPQCTAEMNDQCSPTCECTARNTVCNATTNTCQCNSSYSWYDKETSCVKDQRFFPKNVTPQFNYSDGTVALIWQNNANQPRPTQYHCNNDDGQFIKCKNGDTLNVALTMCKTNILKLKITLPSGRTKIVGNYDLDLTQYSPCQELERGDINVNTSVPHTIEIAWTGNGSKHCTFEFTITESAVHNLRRSTERREKKWLNLENGSSYNLTLRVVKIFNLTMTLEATSITVTTKIIVPSKPLNISAKLSASNSTNGITVNWDMPDPYPGPTNYTVRIRDFLNNNQEQQQKNVFVGRSTKWNNSMSFDFDLYSPGLWLYAFDVRACTVTGCSPWSKITHPVETLGTKSSGPLFYIRKGDTWSEAIVHIQELQPMQRKMYYTQYEIVFLDNVTGSNQTRYVDSTLSRYVGDAKMFLTEGSHIDYSQPVTVIPGVNHTFQVRAVHLKEPTRLGHFSIRDYNVLIGKPKVLTTAQIRMVVPNKTVTKSDHHVSFLLTSNKFFIDQRNGNITARGLLLSSASGDVKPLTHAAEYNKLPFYLNAKEEGLHRYRVNFRELSSPSYVPTRLTLGNGNPGSEECLNNKYTCNGPLKRNTLYSVRGFACTTAGCVDVKLLSVMTLKNSDDHTYVALAVSISSVITVTILAVVVIALAYRWMRRTLTIAINNRPSVIALGPIMNPTKLICLEDLENTVDKMHANSGLEFQREFTETLNKIPARTFYEYIVPDKNRYLDICPYTDSIVLLSEQSDDPSTRYINASFIPGYNNGREFIATQGPLACTTADFWRLVWEREVQVVVMLTQTREGKVDKCEQYWPQQRGTTSQYGQIHVTCNSVSSINNYNISIFALTHEEVNNVTKEVKHFQFMSWKDHSAAIVASEIVQFVADVRSHVNPQLDIPVLIHCSAGVGRTGTYIAIDYIQQLIQTSEFDDTLDILGFVANMRKHRVMMVQTEKQYVLIHDCAKYMMQKHRKHELGIRDLEEESQQDNVTPTSDTIHEVKCETKETLAEEEGDQGEEGKEEKEGSGEHNIDKD